jgi:hypothetical protein
MDERGKGWAVNFNILAVALALSLTVNGVLGWAYLGQRDTATVAVTEQKQVTTVATACSAGTEQLQQQAAKRAAEAAPTIKKADQVAQQHEARAQQILVAPPSTPANDCKSAGDAIDVWLQGRAAP